MAKPGARSSETKNAAGNLGSGGQAVSTHPNTRTIGTQVGAVKPATVPIPSIADCESRRQKPSSPVVPVSNAFDTETTEAAQAHLPHPVGPDVAVPTKH